MNAITLQRQPNRSPRREPREIGRGIRAWIEVAQRIPSARASGYDGLSQSPRPNLRNLLRRNTAGFSLLEVVLAFAILAGSLAVLGQLIGIGFRSAREAEGMTESQMLCQTIMDEIIVGVRMTDPVQDIPIDMLSDTEITLPGRTVDWAYSIDSQPAPIEGLLAVQVSVRRINATSLADADQFQLIRWIPDPEAELLEMPDASDPNSTSSTSGGSI